jgi:hypothetical protein
VAKNKFSDEELEFIQKQIDENYKLYDYRTKDYPFEVVFSKYGEEDHLEKTLYVPKYQRAFVWNPKKQSKFIESVLLGVPLTPFLVSEDEEGRLEIIDGSQRIRTLIAFFENTLKLRALTKLKEINTAKYKDLPRRSQTYFKNRDFKFIIADKAIDAIKHDIFARINTTSERLSDSEIRKGSYSGEFYNMILELKNHEQFRGICPISKDKALRGEYEELILRFFVYIDKYKEVKHEVAMFLNNYLEEVNEEGFEKEILLTAFKNMVNFIDKYFPIGFRKEKNSNSTPRVRFEAIAIGVYLALEENSDLKNPNMEWLESGGFKAHATSDASNNSNRLVRRVEFVRDALLGKLSEKELNLPKFNNGKLNNG